LHSRPATDLPAAHGTVTSWFLLPGRATRSNLGTWLSPSSESSAKTDRPIRLHDLRHTNATLLKQLGVPARDAMEILGHSRIAVTLEIYTAADDSCRREAIARLNDLFGPGAA
jgi:integrase